MQKIKKIIILDRDGVLNKDLPKGVKNLSELEIYSDYIKSLKSLLKFDISFCIASNQSNVGRGLLKLSTLRKINSKIKSSFKEHGLKIDHIYCCIHKPEDNCNCRKPKSGLITKIISKYKKDTEFLFIGDSVSDYQAAQGADIPFVLVGTGKGKSTKLTLPDVRYFKDLKDFVMTYEQELEIKRYFDDHIRYFQEDFKINRGKIIQLSEKITDFSKKGGLIITAGNGGSSAHAEHLVAELQVRFEKERDSIAALSLTSNSAIQTASANDYSFENAYKRILSGFVKLNNNLLLILFSTSGESENIVNLAKYAKLQNIEVLSFTGSQKSSLAKISDINISSNSGRTCLIQDFHQFLIHALCIGIDIHLTDCKN